MQRPSVETLYGLRTAIRDLHSTHNLSWREIAALYGFSGLSHTTFAAIANGHEPSAETCRRLGVRKTDRYRRHFEGGMGEKGRRRVRHLDEWLEDNGWGSLTEAIEEIVGIE